LALRVWSSERLRVFGLGLVAAAALTGADGKAAADAVADPTLATQWAEYEAVQAKTILELQPFRQIEAAQLSSGATLGLFSLAPGANAWFLLTLEQGDQSDVYHLENVDPRGQTVALGPGPALVLTTGDKTVTCAPWEGDPAPLTQARTDGLPYETLCEGRLYLRNPAHGARTWRESVTDFLRDEVWGGDELVQFVKDNFYRDAFAQKGESAAGAGTGSGPAGPPSAPLSDDAAKQPAIATGMGLGLTGTEAGKMRMGAWYPVADVAGVYASAIIPQSLAPEVFSLAGDVSPLDSVETGAADYLVAFDLGQLDLGFALGTDHPRVDWSSRPPGSVREAGLPGPDGVGSSDPLVRLGQLSPALAADAVATFAGGFKREHGAFRWGPFSTVNGGSHYGFLEQGVIFSRLQPGLSTLYVLDDGTVGMKTWTAEDDALLPRLRFARQNGVALVEPDPATGQPAAGTYVAQWSAGNWSGSADAKLRTLRSGACLEQRGGAQYLVFGYFSTATPSVMARVFQAYGCDYAMGLDMNAPELTYLAVYAHGGGQIQVEHLVPEMAASDQTGAKGGVLPRFIGFPDSRDFFYLVRKR
jgi:hypothetical protein